MNRRKLERRRGQEGTGCAALETTGIRHELEETWLALKETWPVPGETTGILHEPAT